jgi:hypothetical protein
MKKNFANLSSWIGFIWLSGWIALRGIPDMGVWRTAFLIIGVGHLILLARNLVARPVHSTLLSSRSTPKIAWSGLNIEGWTLVVLTVWLVLQSAFISPTPLASLAELGDEWGKLLLSIGVAIWLVLKVSASNDRPYWLILGLFFGYFAHVISTLSYQVWSYIYSGNLAPMNSFLGNYGYASVFVAGVFAFLVAEMVLRFQRQQWLPFSKVWLVFIIIATFLAAAVLNAKSAIVGAIVLFVAGAAIVAIHSKSVQKSLLLLAGAMIVLIVSMSWNNRWHGAYEAISAVVNTPLDIKGLTVIGDGSFYLRGMWAKASLQGIVEYPFGLGYGSDAFGRYIVKLGAPAGAVSSHSGWLDFALANGVLGLGLLLSLFVLVMRRGWYAYQAGHAVGLVLVFVVLNFAVRSFIDGHLFGSRFVGFAFVAAVLWALMVIANNTQQRH